VNLVSIPYELKSLRRNFEFPRKLPSAAKADVDFNGLLGTVKTVPFQNGFFPLSLKRRRFFALFAKTSGFLESWKAGRIKAPVLGR
jgi:hypothetical protein